MKRTVLVELEVDPTEYHEAVDSREGTVALVRDMLNRDADLPKKYCIICENYSEYFKEGE